MLKVPNITLYLRTAAEKAMNRLNHIFMLALLVICYLNFQIAATKIQLILPKLTKNTQHKTQG